MFRKLSAGSNRWLTTAALASLPVGLFVTAGLYQLVNWACSDPTGDRGLGDIVSGLVCVTWLTLLPAAVVWRLCSRWRFDPNTPDTLAERLAAGKRQAYTNDEFCRMDVSCEL